MTIRIYFSRRSINIYMDITPGTFFSYLYTTTFSPPIIGNIDSLVLYLPSTVFISPRFSSDNPDSSLVILSTVRESKVKFPESYSIEINKFFPDLKLSQEACPLWVPFVENMELNNRGTQFFFVKRHIDSLLKKDPRIDTIILGCTLYPLLEPLSANHFLLIYQLLARVKLLQSS